MSAVPQHTLSRTGSAVYNPSISQSAQPVQQPKKKDRFLPVLLALIALSPGLPIHAQDTPEAVRQKLEQQYPLTKTTADKTDIVTAGAVLVLQKDGLEMSSLSSQAQAQNIYKGGKIAQGSMTALAKSFSHCAFCGHKDTVGSTRTFVAGEKFWITKVEVHDDGVILSLFSDPISDVRYTATLKFPYNKGSAPPSGQLVSSVAEVLKVQPSDDAKADPGKVAAPAPAVPAPPAAVPAMAAIAPPPPPADAPPPEPKTVKIGQTRDQVVALFGAPTKVAKLPTKEIDYYPDMKVTYVHDKVTNIQ